MKIRKRKMRRRYCSTNLYTLYTTTTTISKPSNTITTLDNTQQTPMHNTWLDPVVNCRQSFQGQKDNKVKKSVSFNNKPEIKTFESEKESRTTKTVRKTVKKIVQPGRVRHCQTELNNFLSNLISILSNLEGWDVGRIGYGVVKRARGSDTGHHCPGGTENIRRGWTQLEIYNLTKGAYPGYRKGWVTDPVWC